MVIFIMKLIYLHQLVYMKLAYKTCCTEDKQKKKKSRLAFELYSVQSLHALQNILSWSQCGKCLKCQYRHIEFERIFSAYNSKCMILEGKWDFFGEYQITVLMPT